MIRRLGVALLATATVLLVAEVSARWLGAVDFPLYRPVAVYGYGPVPGQSGTFLHKNRWAYNDDAMATSRPFTGGGVLLVGNSIVDGGVWLDRGQRLASRLTTLIDEPVWPVAAGSWTLSNELAFLRSRPDITRRVRQVVLVVRSGDLDGIRPWPGDRAHPDHRPWSALLSAFDRLVLDRLGFFAMAAPGPDHWRDAFAEFAAHSPAPILVVLYPDRGQVWLRENGLGKDEIAVSADPRWGDADYRDGVHPNARGTDLLAAIISSALRRPASLTGASE